jgi:hypothetical protein
MHPQVTADDGSVLEGQQQIFSDGLDALEPPSIDALRDTEERGPGVRRMRVDDIALQRP